MLAPLAVLLAVVATAQAGGQAAGPPSPAPGGETFELPVVFPEHPTDEEDAYLCTAVKLPDRPLKLVGIEPTSDQRIVHHMLLFGCQVPAQTEEVWNCRMSPVCGTSSEGVLYGWGKNAPAVTMPHGSGFSVGPGTGVRTLVLQMHYLHGRPANDTSGIKLRLSTAAVPYSAGMVAFASMFQILPRTNSTLVKNSCCYSGWEPLHGFATRVHTHKMGREVYLDKGRPTDRSALERVVSLSPQKPQGFYPVKPEATFLPGDQLTMACDFDSTNVDHTVVSGHTAADEMCNLYMMLYSQLPYFGWCLDNHTVVEMLGPGGLPVKGQMVPEATVWQPPEAVKRAGAAAFKVGQVSGLASSGDGTVWVVHRGERAWNPDGTVANSGSVVSGGMEEEGALPGPVVLQLDQDSGALLQSWGSGQFVMPHMVTLDYDGNLWITDVALHQAIKLDKSGKQLLALGQAGKPGAGPNAFCKPTQVAVGRDGSLYVSDGYCNSRVAQFDAAGKWLRDFMVPEGQGPPLLVPHSVVVHECLHRLLVAERERGRVHAFDLDGTYIGLWDIEQTFGMPYSLTLGPYGSVLALTWQPAVTPAKSFLVALDANHPGTILGSWSLPGLQYPHDLVLVPAPLEATGAGERLLSVLVAETKDSGQNMNKFVLTPPEALPGSNASAAASGAAAGGSPAGGSEPLTEAELAEQKAVSEAKAKAAAHFGGSTHAAGGQAAAAGGGEEGSLQGEEARQEDEAAAVGHRPVRPVDAGKEPREEADEEEVETIGHGLVKPVEHGGTGGEGSGEGSGDVQQPPQAQQQEPVVQQPRGQHTRPAREQQPPAGQQQQQEGAAQQEERTAEQQEEAEEEAEWEALMAATSERDSGGQQAQQAQQAQQQQVEEEGEAAAGGASGQPAEQQHDVAVKAAEAEQEGWFSAARQKMPGQSVGGMLPAVLGLVFVGVALLSWNRVQHWRRRGGAGYQPTSTGRPAAAGEAQFNGQGHLGTALEHRSGPPPASPSPAEHV